MAEGQRLRWWQEEQTQTAREASERVAAVPTAVVTEAAEHYLSENDTWAELEAEALCRAARGEIGKAQAVSSFLNKPILPAHSYSRAKFFRVLAAIQASVFFGLAGLLIYTGLYLHKPDYFHFLMCVVFGIFALWRARMWQKS